MALRIPVHVVTGAPESGAFIERMCAVKADWAGLVQRTPSLPAANVRAVQSGCPCCTGRVVMQILLARLLRETGAKRAFVELPDAGHAITFARVLAEPPLGQAVAAARQISLPGDDRLTPEDLESSQVS